MNFVAGEIAMMLPGNPSRDRQPEPAAARGAGCQPDEAIEDPITLVPGNPWAVVLHAEPRLLALPHSTNPDVTSGPGSGDSVVEQIANDAG